MGQTANPAEALRQATQVVERIEDSTTQANLMAASAATQRLRTKLNSIVKSGITNRLERTVESHSIDRSSRSIAAAYASDRSRYKWFQIYVLRSLPDRTAMPIFIWLHIPLFGAIVWLTHHSKLQIRGAFRQVFCASLLVHGALHYRLSSDPLSTFNSALSLTLIYGGAICGAVYLLTSTSQHYKGYDD